MNVDKAKTPVVKFQLDGQEQQIFEPPRFEDKGHIASFSDYMDVYNRSLTDADQYWRSVAEENLFFETPSAKGLEWNFDPRLGEVFVRFMAGAKTNVAHNCLEKNIGRGLANRIAFFWEGNEDKDQCQITYGQLLERVVAFAKALRGCGIGPSDRVVIYLPMVLEVVVAMLACARIGAVHCVVFAGFSADSLMGRIHDVGARMTLVDQALFDSNQVDTVIVLKHLDRITTPSDAPSFVISQVLTMRGGRDLFWEDVEQKYSYLEAPVYWADAEEPLFILHTSGSTGKPKGIVHSTAGYMLQAFNTTRNSFDLHPDTDIYWSTADVGWITGHTYLVYGPLLNAATSLMFEGILTYPEPSRMWQLVEKYRVTKLYTSPTLVRSLMAFGDAATGQYCRDSLKVIGSVGEPINPSAWLWLYNVIGKGKVAVVDTYWQTETGSHAIAPLPMATATKPGSATFPCLGIQLAILDGQGRQLEGPGEGNLCFTRAWPGMMRGVWGDRERYKAYFSVFPGFYFTGDGARRDEDGYIWVTGRIDDLMNVSGHLLSTAEIESALAGHGDVVEAAVVAAPHSIKGHSPYAFVTLANGKSLTQDLLDSLKLEVRRRIGPIAVPDWIQLAPGLPKTRSGKVTRRILRKIAEGDVEADLGDTSTLLDQSVITELWAGREHAG